MVSLCLVTFYTGFAVLVYHSFLASYMSFSFTFPVPRHGLWLFGILWWPPEQNFQSLYMWTSALSCK